MTDIWFREGVISSRQYGDSYFSHVDGYQETQHVFLGGNDLPARMRGAKTFCVAELGFGTGLNFLSTVQLWRAVGRGVLTYVGFELHPLSPAEMRQALVPWQDTLGAVQEEVLSVGVPQTPGVHDVLLDQVRLVLVHGDAHDMMQQWADWDVPTVDAWYLDGFAPGRNPGLWNPVLMQQVFAVTKPGGTGATYTSAGWVRRMLAEVGFAVEKVPGFANKREMSTLKKI